MTELYKRFRPKRLKQVVGNDATVKALTAMLAGGSLPHTILFHGPSGCGKTTLARIVANKLKCHDMDLQEVNSSSFRGIDTIRQISQTMWLASVGPCRVWIIDECHKLTNDAQNAALKMLEDTPQHVYFFLCTTTPEKLIKAVRTRCCEMSVAPLSNDQLTRLVLKVAKKAEISITPSVLTHVVELAQGCPRTALVLFDKVSNLPEDEQRDAVKNTLAEQNEAIDLCRALIKKATWAKVADILKNLKGEPESIRWAVLGYARSVLLSKQASTQAFLVIQVFQENFYDSKAAGLAAACYECVHGEDR